jgi:hypothetical protein
MRYLETNILRIGACALLCLALIRILVEDLSRVVPEVLRLFGR